MIARLKDRNKQIPGGLRFLQPETGWKPYPFSSFDTIVRQLIVHRSANPYLRDKNSWATDYEVVANEVDRFNSKVCEEMGWTAYILTEANEPPKSTAPRGGRVAGRAGAAVGKIAAGMATLGSWLGAGAVPVLAELSEARAQTCLKCPQHGQGDWKAYFTKKAADVVQRQLEERTKLKLETTVDDQLGVCMACDCPMKLKVHVGLKHILDRIPADSKAKLDKNCWILAEERQ